MIARATGAILSPYSRQEGERERPALTKAAPPTSLDFRPNLPPVWDQGAEGSCTGHALAGLAAFMWPGWSPSRRDPYWQGRNLLGMEAGSEGAHMAAVLKAGQRWGYLPEDVAPYAPHQPWAPPPNADELRKAHHLGTYWRLSRHMDLGAFVGALWSNGPAVVVVETDAAFNAADGGWVVAPSKTGGLGLHAVLVVGYDATREAFIIRNSWGLEWGDQGHALVSWLWLALRMHEAWQASTGSGDPSPRPFWEMLFPQLFLQAMGEGLGLG